ncbi:MAG: DUF1501 domain-containing protein [Saprospiraceae bacterium]|nr:DUF1501 domain-containing protein [Saprospiraceae bacterium]
MHHKLNRRRFLGQASCAGMGYLTLMNTLTNLRAINAAAISNSSVADADDYKAIVCVLLAGGNDSFNMLIPYDDMEHGHYVTARQGLYTDPGSGLAIPKSMLMDTKLNYSEGSREWALHPSMPEFKSLFDAGQAAIFANIGTLLRPTTKMQYDADLNLPLGLFSHSDQIEEWQTGIPGARTAKGWGGKMADLLNDCNGNENISMNMSLSGSNVWQQGNQTVEYAISATNGAVGMTNYDPSSTSLITRIRTQAIDGLLASEYQNIFDKTYMDVVEGARDGFLEFDAAIGSSYQFGEDDFPDTPFGQSLEMIARVISIRNLLSFKRQTFFVRVGGWDHHDEVIDKQNEMLAMVSQAIGAFQNALAPDKVNVEDQVLTMFISEFGRTLSSNGNGSDHAWGGNTMAFGGPNLINGGQFYGSYPTLSVDTPDPQLITRGRFIPTLSTDEYFATIARWFGVSNLELPILFPNIGEFYALDSPMLGKSICFANLCNPRYQFTIWSMCRGSPYNQCRRWMGFMPGLTKPEYIARQLSLDPLPTRESSDLARSLFLEPQSS